MPTIRPMTPADRHAVAALIHASTNHWYAAHAGPTIFAGPDVTSIFFDTYADLDDPAGRCPLGFIAEDDGRLAGSCFYHPRETHVSLGIMNVDPASFGHGIARRLLAAIVDVADRARLPLRLVSSAMNLDSFSLYSRAGFVPGQAFQDMLLPVPDGGLPFAVEGAQRVRDARPHDISAIAALEQELTGLRREQDYRYFVANARGIWHLSVHEGPAGRIDGFCASCAHAGCNMVGPGAARTDEAMIPLLHAQYSRHPGRTPVCLVPMDRPALVHQMYAWGARNCEIHFAQCRGPNAPVRGVFMPTFLPESA